MSEVRSYLEDLRAELRVGGALERRILGEVEDHLREAAREEGSESEAVRRFGPAPALARDFLAGAAVGRLRQAARALAVALGLAFLAAYPIPEQTLPPAPWPEGAMPGYLAWKLDAVLVLLALALAGAVVALVLTHRRAPPVGAAAAAVGFAGAALAATLGLGAVLALQWWRAVPGSGATLALVAATSAAALAVAGVFAARAALVAVRLR